MTQQKKILVTCPPMLKQIQHFTAAFDELGWAVTAPEVAQTLSVAELVKLVPEHDGWIIGDDPATAEVAAAACAGRLKAAVKWGVGVDNVDLAAFAEAGLPVNNTPGMFGNEVADNALGYLIALARQTYQIHDAVRQGQWPKPTGQSLAGKVCGLVGFGDIGRQLEKRLAACGMEVVIYDPACKDDDRVASWPQGLPECDYICFTCALNEHNYHMLDAQVLADHCKPGVRVVNVARGPLIDEPALEEALANGLVDSVALDVFEVEPLPMQSNLRQYSQNLFGSHNSSNTHEAVVATSYRAIELLREALS